MKRIPTPLIVAALLAALIALIPLVFPYSLIQARLETRFSRIVHGKVEIGKIHFSYTPLPAFMLDKVKIDSPDEAFIERISIPFTPRNLLNFGRELHEVSLDGATFSRGFMLGLPARLTPDNTKRTRIDQIKFENASLKLAQGMLGPVAGFFDFHPDGRLEKLSIHSPDSKLLLEIQPAEASTFNVQFSAKNWKLPFGHPVEFEYINMTGKANTDALLITDIHAGIYNGLVTGNGQLQWADRWKLSGKIFARSIRAEQLVSVFSPVTRTTGILGGDGTFAYEADNYLHAFDAPRLAGRFSIQDGMLHNIDLITPLKSPSQEVIRNGGQTNFNVLSGSISVQPDTISLHNLHLESGKFRANGDLLLRGGKLTGGAAATLNAGTIIVSNQISLTGTLAAPELRSGGAWRPRSEETAVKAIGQ